MTSKLREDFRVFRPQSRYSKLRAVLVAINNPGFRAVLGLRVQEFFCTKKMFAVAKVIRNVNYFFTGADFCVGFTAGPGLRIEHPNGIVAGAGARVGSHCTLLQQVTLGEKYADGSGGHGYPTLGDYCVVGAGAKVLGAVTLGNEVVVGANSVAIKDAPSKSILVGVPAHVLTRRSASSGDE